MNLIEISSKRVKFWGLPQVVTSLSIWQHGTQAKFLIKLKQPFAKFQYDRPLD